MRPAPDRWPRKDRIRAQIGQASGRFEPQIGKPDGFLIHSRQSSGLANGHTGQVIAYKAAPVDHIERWRIDRDAPLTAQGEDGTEGQRVCVERPSLASGMWGKAREMATARIA